LSKHNIPLVPHPPYSPYFLLCFCFLNWKTTKRERDFRSDSDHPQCNTGTEEHPKRKAQGVPNKLQDYWNHIESGGGCIEGVTKAKEICPDIYQLLCVNHLCITTTTTAAAAAAIIIIIIIIIIFSRSRPLGLFQFRIYFLNLTNLLDSW
jgi:hypothetical protein